MSIPSKLKFASTSKSEFWPFGQNSSLRVDPLFQKKEGSTKQREKACYSHPINYSNSLFKLFLKGV